MLEMTDSFVCSVKLTVVGRPFLLRRGQLLGKEGEGFPTLGASLLQDGSDGDVRSVRSDGEREGRVRM